MYSFDEIEIAGHVDNVSNEYLRLKTGAERYAIVFPGRGYTTQAPLLYYTNRFLLHKGINVLNINYDYMNNQDFATKAQEEQMEWLRDDVLAAYRAAEEQLQERAYCLVGKSLGTIALAYILEEIPDSRDLRFIWHTPLILLPQVQRAIKEYSPRSLLVIGTEDPHFDESVLTELVQRADVNRAVIEGANHGMEASTDPIGLLQVMEQVIQSLEEFFDG
ncbi:hypothetical protein EU546_03845 [Candidatus Thorarchaeota archaeon]|nr:MAG: hypothetical protein EU546_03845 [Candidatus Thorarchaeota archaeon]